ncbi:MAG TPA: SDR family oxidoreductase [Gemmatales bacterium]|nr:SDR family oxidoreductase [Gemmatales bacterium]
MGMFTDKVALVTGGTSGIGREAAIAFAREGARVVIAGRREKEGAETVALIQQAGSQGLFVKTDVSQEADVQAMVEKTLHAFGRIDAAFNNAGIEGTPFVPTHQQTVDNYQQVMNINVLGVLLCMKHQIPALQKSGGGAIVNNASVTGTVGMAGMSVYVASKHAVLGLTKSTALELAKENIRVNAVSPGLTESEMFDRFASLGSTREVVAGLTPNGRIATAAEVAAAVLFLCSPAASYITGSNLAIDGGWTAQ